MYISVQSMNLKKQGAKQQGQCYSKREEEAWPLLFLNNDDPVFCTLLFSGPYFGPVFFQGCKHIQYPCFQIENSGCRLTGGKCTRHVKSV